MTVKKQTLGTLCDGQKVSLYSVSNGKMSFCAMDYGCTLTGIFLPNKIGGGKTDILLGHSTLDAYVASSSCFGSIVGRFANRIGGAKFSIGKDEYSLDKNDNDANTLHGGYTRLDHFVWKSAPIEGKEGCGVKFTRRSVDGEQGFPGNLDVCVSYTLGKDNRLTMKYTATTDKPTPVNFTNHAYFNLAGGGTVLEHTMQSDCEGYLEVDKNLIPTGKIIPVSGTAFDFTKEKPLGRDIAKTGSGYDHCFVTPAYGKENSAVPLKQKPLVVAAILRDIKSGRKMTVETNLEGIQVYTANSVGGVVGKNGRVYKKHEAVCLETQCFPDTPNKAEFPSCILHPGETYKAVTVYGFEF